MVYSFDAKDAPNRKKRQYYEMFGNRAIWVDGWKAVAFTRLIPLFPFNLLNYVFGLTKVKFRHYAIASFFCMLPACIAYIVFSSSLLDVLKGKITTSFLVGLSLIVAVSLIPVLHKRFKPKKMAISGQ